MQMRSVHYGFELSISGDGLRRSRLLFDPRLNGSGGINTSDLSRSYPREYMRPIGDWLSLAEEQGRMGAVVVQTWRNLIQNDRCIAYTREVGLCQSAHEQAEASIRPYWGISFLNNGRLRGERVLPARGFATDVDYFAAGVPVVWGGRVLAIDEILGEVADFAHVWRLQKSGPDDSPGAGIERFRRLQKIFDETRHASATEAIAALLDGARGSEYNEGPLVREDSYLHQVTGVLPDGGLVIVIAHGTLEEVGEMAREAGAEHAVVVDNGGSCSVALRQRPGGELRPLVESYYYRTPAIAVAIHELADAADARFLPRPLPWRQERSVVRVTGSRSVFTNVPITFETDHGAVHRVLPVSGLDSAAAASVAVIIGNFAVIYGALAVRLQTPVDFVTQVRAKFAERYRAASRSQDPTRLRGMWLDGYLEHVNGRPFSIDIADPASPARVSARAQGARELHQPVRWAAGVDVGASEIKCEILLEGEEVKGQAKVLTRGTAPVYTSEVLNAQLVQVVKEALTAAGIRLDDVAAVGVSWPGAVRNGIAATSRTLLDMRDVLSGTQMNVSKLEEIRNLAPYVGKVLSLSGQTISVFNDGEVAAVYEGCRSNRRRLLYCRVGSSVAGGFIDRDGYSSYLTELGRCVIRTDTTAPRNPFSGVQGVASALIGGGALAQLCSESGITRIDGAPVSAPRAGHDVAEILDTRAPQASTAAAIVDEMGANLAELLTEAVLHLEEVSHIRLGGGLLGSHAVGKRLRLSVMAHLEPRLGRKVVFDDGGQLSGAFATAWLAARS